MAIATAPSVEMWADNQEGIFYGYWTGQDGVALGKTISANLPSMSRLLGEIAK